MDSFSQGIWKYTVQHHSCAQYRSILSILISGHKTYFGGVRKVSNPNTEDLLMQNTIVSVLSRLMNNCRCRNKNFHQGVGRRFESMIFLVKINIFGEISTFDETEISKNWGSLTSPSLEEKYSANPKHSGTIYQKNPQELENLGVQKFLKNIS